LALIDPSRQNVQYAELSFSVRSEVIPGTGMTGGKLSWQPT
jgi:hypothetical protein